MHTPDSRIRADYGLPPGVPTRAQAGHLVDQMTPELRAEMEAYWERADAATQDTSTTAGKIAVMQHAAQYGAQSIECRKRTSTSRENFSRLECDTDDIRWNWEFFDYRIAPPPAPRSALSVARLKVSSGLGQFNSLKALVKEVDASPVVTAFNDPLTDEVCVSHPREKLTPGRYRLLRDDQ